MDPTQGFSSRDSVFQNMDLSRLKSNTQMGRVGSILGPGPVRHISSSFAQTSSWAPDPRCSMLARFPRYGLGRRCPIPLFILFWHINTKWNRIEDPPTNVRKTRFPLSRICIFGYELGPLFFKKQRLKFFRLLGKNRKLESI